MAAKSSILVEVLQNGSWCILGSGRETGTHARDSDMETEKKKILLIDDSPVDLEAARELLELDGYEVYTHQSSFGATNTIMTCRPHLILMDINMPGLRGESLSEIVRSYHEIQDIPIVFLSSDDEGYMRQLVRQSGNAGYIRKGNPAELREKVRIFLKGT